MKNQILATFVSEVSCEIEESGGFLKYVCDKNQTHTMYKCAYSEEYFYFEPRQLLTPFQGDSCSNDPHFYQACNRVMGGKITNGLLLCEFYLCHWITYYGDPGRLIGSDYLSFLDPCRFFCLNTELNFDGCEAEKEENTILPSGASTRSNDICNDVCDTTNCEDEATCNGFTYGIYCTIKVLSELPTYIPPLALCNGAKSCDMGEDEANCEEYDETKTTCTHRLTGKMVPVINSTICSPVQKTTIGQTHVHEYCQLNVVALHQTNCSDPTRVGLICDINGFNSSVSKYIICFDDQISACDDKIDSKCFKTKNCNVHKHRMCDDVMDCDDKADEEHPICLSTTEATCKRRIGTRKELPIPISWLKDGDRDCEDGSDETSDWPMCGSGKTARYVGSKDMKCENVFICRTGDPGYVELQDLCDGLETCGNENQVCSVSRRSQSLETSVPTSNKGLTKQLSFCLEGLSNLELLIGSCKTQKFIFPDEEIFGVNTKTSLILPSGEQSCDSMYGELYLYTSCTGGCKNSSCPLRNVPRYEVCPDQFKDRVGTIVNNGYLIFLTKSYGTIYTNQYFVCDDKIKCIDYSKVCDLVNDCKDGSDELYCTNHFKCNSSDDLMAKTKKCDGKIDCADLSDECNDQCTKEILEDGILKVLAWLIGILAVVANLAIIGNSLRKVKNCRTSAALINRFLIITISLGDFLIGCYLFIIATYDTIVFRRGYCLKQIEWITSVECSITGVFSTIGSQISLFAMTGLSIVRVYGIWNSMKIAGEVTPLKVIKIITMMIIMAFISAAIAVIPIIESLEDFYVNGVKFSDGLKIFIGSSDKEQVLNVVEAYYGRTKDASLSWQMLIPLVQDMFSHEPNYEDLTKTVAKVNFYGNDGVCLFKYFVKNDDPQKLYVWSILSLNFFCFLFISASYIVIGILSGRSSKSLTRSQNNRQISQRNRRMNRRIAMIIATDFMCWVPFIATCILHSLEIIDATPWYSMFSMVILPINSVINPFLYDDIVFQKIKSTLRLLSRQTSNSAFSQSNQVGPSHQSTQIIGLNQLSNQLQTASKWSKKGGLTQRSDEKSAIQIAIQNDEQSGREKIDDATST